MNRHLSARLLLAMFVLAGCGSGDSSSTTQPSTDRPARVSLQLNWKPEPQFGGFYAASEIGAYKKHNLDVEIVPGGVGTPTVQMVAAGKVPFGIVSADELILSRSNGADVVALFAVYQTNPQGLMVHASRGLNSISDIFANPGTVAMQRGLPYASYLEKKYGFDKVRLVPSPGGDLSVFRNDTNYSMQCFITSEPIAAKRLGLDAQTFLIADAGYNPYTTVLVTNGETLRSNINIAKAMIAAVGEGWRAYLDNPGPINMVMQKLNPTMDAQTFADSAEAQKPLIETDQTKQDGLGAMTAERWQTLGSQLVELKLIPEAPAAEECFLRIEQPIEK